jgi:hypothetical protein
VTTDRHRELQQEAIALEADGHRALLDNDDIRARDELRAASDRYRESWEAAPPDAYGRLVGMLKASVVIGEAETAARYVHTTLGDDPDSPTAAYAVAIAALVHGDDDRAAKAAASMREGGEAFARTADAIAALAAKDEGAYTTALQEIVDDFAGRDAYLTGVPIADTAVMLERLAGARGITTDVRSPLLPRP